MFRNVVGRIADELPLVMDSQDINSLFDELDTETQSAYLFHLASRAATMVDLYNDANFWKGMELVGKSIELNSTQPVLYYYRARWTHAFIKRSEYLSTELRERLDTGVRRDLETARRLDPYWAASESWSYFLT